MTAGAPQLAWVAHEPKQTRSQRTLDALLDAAEGLLAERRFAELTVRDITERAGCSVGTFYTRFTTKDDLLRALYARYVDRSERTLAVWSDPARWEGVDLPQIVHALVQFIVADFRARRGVRRAFDAAMPGDPELFSMMEALTTRTVHGLARLLEARSDAHHHADAERAAAFLHRLVFGVLEQDVRLDVGPAGHTLDDAAMTVQLTEAVCAWLGAPWSR